MVKLDDPKIITKYDKCHMLAVVESFPRQCLEAKKIGLGFKLPGNFKTGFKNIVCTGLGGSAIGADIARSYIADEAKIPILVNRNYSLPKFVNRQTLVIVASYSGNTEETLSAYEDARSKGATLIAITSGGKLHENAIRHNTPTLLIPKGLQPRCALGYAFFPLLILLSKIGVISNKSKEIDEAIKVLGMLKAGRIGHEITENKNPAKSIARALYLKYPVIYGSNDHIDCVVTRWRGEFAENSKALSSSHVFPELTHNEIVGWENPPAVIKNSVVIILRDSGDHPRISKRMDIAANIIKGMGVKVIEVNSVGKGLLARVFSLIYIGDFASFYLAILNKLDPTPVDRIAYLKKELARK